jgi:hypothetical protein
MSVVPNPLLGEVPASFGKQGNWAIMCDVRTPAANIHAGRAEPHYPIKNLKSMDTGGHPAEFHGGDIKWMRCTLRQTVLRFHIVASLFFLLGSGDNRYRFESSFVSPFDIGNTDSIQTRSYF